MLRHRQGHRHRCCLVLLVGPPRSWVVDKRVRIIVVIIVVVAVVVVVLCIIIAIVKQQPSQDMLLLLCVLYIFSEQNKIILNRCRIENDG